jgi:hypothetical protein
MMHWTPAQVCILAIAVAIGTFMVATTIIGLLN